MGERESGGSETGLADWMFFCMRVNASWSIFVGSFPVTRDRTHSLLAQLAHLTLELLLLSLDLAQDALVHAVLLCSLRVVDKDHASASKRHSCSKS